MFYNSNVFSGKLQAQNKTIDLTSPNGELKVSISLRDKIYYSITGNGQKLLTNNHLGLILQEEVMGQDPKLLNSKRSQTSDTLKPYVALKFSVIKNTYNDLLLTFKGNYAVEFRAFDDGIAYRIITTKKGNIEVTNEDFSINFPDNYLLHLQLNNGFNSAYEEAYQHISTIGWKAADKMANLPILIDTQKEYKLLISESDLFDYPCLFLKSTGNNGAEGAFPKPRWSLGQMETGA